MKILLVEDSPEQAIVVQSFIGLTHPDAALSQAGNLKDALAELKNAEFDAILLDLGLPDASGIDVVDQIHNGAPGTPILVLTAAGDEGLGSLCIQAGAHDYIQKSGITPEILARAINFSQVRKAESLQLELARHIASLKTVSGDASKRAFKAFKPTYSKLLHDPRFLMSKSHKKLAVVMCKKGVKASEIVALHAHCLEEACKDAEVLDLGRLLLNSPTIVLATTRFLADAYRKQARSDSKK